MCNDSHNEPLYIRPKPTHANSRRTNRSGATASSFKGVALIHQTLASTSRNVGHMRFIMCEEEEEQEKERGQEGFHPLVGA